MTTRARFAIRMLVVVALVCLILMATAFRFVEEVAYPDTLCEMLLKLGTSAFVSMAVGAFVAALVEYWPKWEGLAPKWKRPIIGGFCLVVPVASLLAQVALCSAILTQDAIYLAFMAGAVAFAGSQFAHIYKLPSG